MSVRARHRAQHPPAVLQDDRAGHRLRAVRGRQPGPVHRRVRVGHAGPGVPRRPVPVGSFPVRRARVQVAVVQRERQAVRRVHGVQHQGRGVRQPHTVHQPGAVRVQPVPALPRHTRHQPRVPDGQLPRGVGRVQADNRRAVAVVPAKRMGKTGVPDGVSSVPGTGQDEKTVGGRVADHHHHAGPGTAGAAQVVRSGHVGREEVLGPSPVPDARPQAHDQCRRRPKEGDMRRPAGGQVHGGSDVPGGVDTHESRFGDAVASAHPELVHVRGIVAEDHGRGRGPVQPQLRVHRLPAKA